MAAPSEASAPVCDWTAREPRAAAVDGQGDHRRAGGHGAGGGAREGPAVAEVLDVDGDDFGGVVGGEGVDEVGGAEVGLVAQRGKAREPEPLGGGDQPQLEREVAALGDEADGARGQWVGDELEPSPGVEHAQAVGPEQHRSGIADALREGRVVLPRSSPPAPALMATSARAPACERGLDGRADRGAAAPRRRRARAPRAARRSEPIGTAAEDGGGAVVDEIGRPAGTRRAARRGPASCPTCAGPRTRRRPRPTRGRTGHRWGGRSWTGWPAGTII